MNGDASTLCVLVIDDDPIFLEMFVRKFSALFRRIVTAKTVSDGIEKMETEHPDATLLDLTFPGHESSKTVERVKRCCGRTALVVVTGDNRKETKEQVIADNAWGCLWKDNVLRSPDQAAAEISSAVEWVQMSHSAHRMKEKSGLVGEKKLAQSLDKYPHHD